MATLRELIIKISANSQSFQTEISRASRMGQDYYRTMQNGGRQAAAATRESERALSDLTNGFASAGKQRLRLPRLLPQESLCRLPMSGTL
jgi:phage-related minor tail protein